MLVVPAGRPRHPAKDAQAAIIPEQLNPAICTNSRLFLLLAIKRSLKCFELAN
jgi:hypothetical protein